MIIRLGCAAAVMLAGFAIPSAAASGSAASGAPGLRVGTQTLQRCGTGTYCGTLRVPLDWQLPGSPDISVCYQWYPATGTGPATGTVMPVEGGPGYPSIGSVAPDGYAAMYGPLLKHDNMLAIDLRGTGCSTVINCPSLQNYTGASGSLALAAVVGQCGDSLNKRWRAPDGSWIHASDLFTSGPAAEDVAAVVSALGIGQVDLYGDSYGSWFAQVFAARYPSLVRSVVLDSTYQVQGLDPWYRSTIATMPGDFNTVCAESPACAVFNRGAAGGSSWTRISKLARYLSAHTVSGTVPGPDGTRQRISMNAVGLVNLVSDAAEDQAIYAALDAAARALLGGGQAAPLLRLYASRLSTDELYFGQPVADYSVGLYMAVSCLDYPQPFPLVPSLSARLADLKSAERALPAGTFAPFSTAQWLAMDQNTETYTSCLDWPAPTIAQPTIAAKPPFLPASMPVLILGGSLDTWTPPVGVPAVREQIGGDSRFVEFDSETHVVGEGDPYGCASTLIQEFVADPAALRSLDASCASQIPTVRAVGSFPSSLAAVVPVRLRSGTASATQARLAAAAVDTAGDALARYASVGASPDAGLYGGKVTASASGLSFRLSSDQLVPGVTVSGTVTVHGSTVSAVLSAVLSAAGPGGVSVSRVTASWPLYGVAATASVRLPSGTAGSMPAPEGVSALRFAAVASIVASAVASSAERPRPGLFRAVRRACPGDGQGRVPRSSVRVRRC
jgi:pimeloyl-ACP methyl ester carboxylesterase